MKCVCDKRIAAGITALCLFIGHPVRQAHGEEAHAAGEARAPDGIDKLWQGARAVLEVFQASVFTAGDFKGPAHAEHVRYRFLEVTNVSAIVVKTASSWNIDGMKGSFCGGEVKGSVSITRQEDDGSAASERGRADTRVELTFRDVELDKLTKMAGITPYKGKLKGRLCLRVRDAAEERLSGEGSFYVHDADLARVPALVKIVGLLGAPSLSRTRFDSAEAHFTLTPRRAVFQSIEIFAADGSVKVSARRNGAISYDGALDFVVEPIIEARFLSGLKLAGEFASTVLKAVEGRVARIRVEGTLSEPQVTWSPHR